MNAPDILNTLDGFESATVVSTLSDGPSNRSYLVERSHDLFSWSPLSTNPGNDAVQIIPVAGDPGQRGNFFRVGVTMP